MPPQQANHSFQCFISTFPPRECGIATFAADLRQAILDISPEAKVGVIALTNRPDGYDYPPTVTFEIKQNQLRDYRLAAEYINLSGVGVVSLQHEYGIFGGEDGGYVIELVENLRKPLVTTLHTVLRNPGEGQKNVLTRVAAVSARLVVMSRRAISILREVYGIPRQKLSLVPHGVPDVPFVDPNYYKDKFGVEGRLVILTFGLLNRNKGIEFMLDALPDVVRRHPQVVYIVLGTTHPEVKRRQGEEYRLWLQRRVRALGLGDHVIFYDRYVDFSELCEFIAASDIYVTPYQSKEQIVSGTLAYAVGMGKAVVSTPYLYAEELLADDRGRLVDFGDTAALGATLLDLIENEAMRHQMRKRAYEFGRQMVWKEVARSYLGIFESTAASYHTRVLWPSSSRPLTSTYDLPVAKLDHLARLTDDTGIIQHATYGIPDRRFGYSTDDAARALVVTLMHYRQSGDEQALSLASKYLAFLRYAQLPDGQFHNFMGYDRQFKDENGSKDTLGRALWGLGVAVAYGPNEGFRALAREMFEPALDSLQTNHPRATAYAICGLHAFLQRYEGAARVRRQLNELAHQLASWCQEDAVQGWYWFGEEITYSNGKMPLAMLLAYDSTGDETYKQLGLRSLDFLLRTTYHNGHFDFVGNQGWFRKGKERALFSQQPVEAGYMAEACLSAHELTGERRYLEMARATVEWLLGRNRLGVALYDQGTGACSDGLEAQGISLNQGAESVISCLLALLAISEQRDTQVSSRTDCSVATPSQDSSSMVHV